MNKSISQSVALDHSPGITRYVQLANFVRHKIVSNEWPAGKVLPTIQTFSNELGIAKITVRQAYAILVRESLITSERGRGSHVTGLPRPADNVARAAVNSWLDAPDGFKIRILKKVEGAVLPSELRLAGNPTAEYVYLKKLHLHNKQIVCVADFYVASEVFARLPKGSEKNNKLAWLLSKHAMDKMKSLHQVITVSQADSVVARILRCNFAAPIAKVKRCITSRSGSIVCASLTNYRATHFIFDMTLPAQIVYGSQFKAAIDSRESD